LPENIASAAQVGLRAIRFENVEQLRRDLKERGLQEELPVPGTVSDWQPDQLEKLTLSSKECFKDVKS
jgi:hypothetical protein